MFTCDQGNFCFYFTIVLAKYPTLFFYDKTLVHPFELWNNIFFIFKCFNLDYLTISWESKEIMVLNMIQVWVKKLKILH